MENRKSKFGKVIKCKDGWGIVVNTDKGGLRGLINEQNALVIPCEYRNIQMAEHGLIMVENQDGIYAYFDHNGKEVVPFSRGYNVVGYFGNGRAIVGKYTQPLDDYINAHMKDKDFNPEHIIIDPVNDTVRSYLHYNSECPRTYGFIDQTGNEVITLKYQDVKSFREGLAAVKDSNGKWGFIDTTGRVVIPFKYDDVFRDFFPDFEGFIKGMAIVKKDGKWGTINKDDVPVIPLEYDEVLPRYIETEIVFKRNGKLSVIAQNGDIAVSH